MDHYQTKVNVEEWYQHTPLGTVHDAHMTDAEHRQLQLMGQDVLTADEVHELNTLTDAFVTDLHDAVNAIAF